MIISISGTHCTGKTTLIETLKQMPEFKDVVFLKSTSKGFSHLGLKANEDGDYLAQLYFLCRDIMQIVENKDKPLVICDRCFFDTLCYSKYLYNTSKMTFQQMKTLKSIVTTFEDFDFIDKIFLLKPSFPLQDEKDRSLNLDFQKEMQIMFEETLLAGNEPYVEYLPDDLQGRIEQIKNFMNL